MRKIFERAPDAHCPRGRLLLITYHFPPGRAVGALRWQNLARYAFERGWGLDVVMLDPADLNQSDESGYQDLPEGVRTFGVSDPPHWLESFENRLLGVYRWLRASIASARNASARNEGSADDDTDTGVVAPSEGKGRPTSLTRDELTFSLTAPRTWARAYWAWVDHLRGRKWAIAAAAAGVRIYQQDTHRLVISCGPPHMAHDAARRLSVKLNLPMAMDMRDPWSLNERVPEPLASPAYLWLARSRERRAIENADLITMNTQPACQAMQRSYPSRSGMIDYVPNAYDERPVPEVERDGRFMLAYAGTVYLDRTPQTLFEAAARLVHELSLSPSEFGIEFMGHIGKLNGEGIDEIAKRAGLDAFVHTHPPADYALAEMFMAKADMLVSLPQDSHLAIPSKIFDYMRFEARVLVFAEAESATEQYLRGSGANVVSPKDVEGALSALREAYREHDAGDRFSPIAQNKRYSRSVAAARMFDAIDAIPELMSPE